MSKTDLAAMGIETEHCAPQSHVRTAERAIRHIKELFRSTLFDLPYLLPNDLYKHLLSYVVSSTNITINSNNDVHGQLMREEQPRSHDFLRGSFGQLVTSYNQLNPNKDPEILQCTIVAMTGHRSIVSCMAFRFSLDIPSPRHAR